MMMMMMMVLMFGYFKLNTFTPYNNFKINDVCFLPLEENCCMKLNIANENAINGISQPDKISEMREVRTVNSALQNPCYSYSRLLFFT